MFTQQGLLVPDTVQLLLAGVSVVGVAAFALQMAHYGKLSVSCRQVFDFAVTRGTGCGSDAFSGDGEGQPAVLLAGLVVQHTTTAALALVVGAQCAQLRLVSYRAFGKHRKVIVPVLACLWLAVFVAMPLWGWYTASVVSTYYAATPPGIIQSAVRVGCAVAVGVVACKRHRETTKRRAHGKPRPSGVAPVRSAMRMLGTASAT